MTNLPSTFLPNNCKADGAEALELRKALSTDGADEERERPRWLLSLSRVRREMEGEDLSSIVGLWRENEKREGDDEGVSSERVIFEGK